MIDIQNPKPKSLRILPGQTVSETRGRANRQIIQNNYGADRRMAERKEKSILTLRRVGRTIDKDESRSFKSIERFRRRLEVEGLDQSKPVPTALKRNHRRIIRGALGDRSIRLLGAVQPLVGMLNAGDLGRHPPKNVGRATGAEFERAAGGGQKRGNFFDKFAAQRRENPIGSSRPGTLTRIPGD